MTTRVVFAATSRVPRCLCRISSSLQTPARNSRLLVDTSRPSALSPSCRLCEVSRGIHASPRSLLATTSQHSPPTSSTGEPGVSSATDDSAASSSQGAQNSSGAGGGNSDGGNGGKGNNRGPLTWGAVGLLGIVGTLIVGYYRMKWDEKQNRVSSEVTSTGKPALGGPFTLVDMHGRPVTDKDFQGSFVMLYFGFCHCPDICPSELVKIGAIAEKLQAKLGEGAVKPVFVSVDPDRDSIAQLRHYSQDFHPSIAYLTGTKDQVAKAAKAYRVYFSKTEEHEDGEDYLVDHSIVIYLIAPNGEFLDFFTQRTTIVDCVERTLKQVKAFKPLPT